MAQDWDIKPRGESCHACQQPFQDKQPYTSALVFGEEGYTRGDYCDGCWQQKAVESVPYSVWQGVFRMPPPKQEEALKKETVESLLRRLMEAEDDANLNVIYILAVMLERKRMLIERDVQTRADGVTIRVYEHRPSGDTFLIPDPRLRLDELEPVQAQVIQMLGVDKEPVEETGETPAAPTVESDPESAAPTGLKGGFYAKTTSDS